MNIDSVKQWLQETGLPYSIETGSRHRKIKLAGRLVGIYPMGGKGTHKRAALNIRAQIRRAAKEILVC